MKRNRCIRKLFAWALCLSMLAGLCALPVLAAPGEDPGAPEAQAPVETSGETSAKAETSGETPAKAETSAPEGETSGETPAKAETSAPEGETSGETSAKAETSASEGETSGETPAKAETSAPEGETSGETPAGTEPAAPDEVEAPTETPAGTEPTAPDEVEAPTETPAGTEPSASDEVEAPEETPAGAEPAASDEVEAPTETPAGTEPSAPESGARPIANSAPVGQELSPDEANGFSFDWSQEEVLDSGWGTEFGVTQTSRGYYLYFACGQHDSAELGVYTEDTPWDPNTPWVSGALGFASVSYDADHLRDQTNNYAVWDDERIEVRSYVSGGIRRTEAFLPADLLPEGDLTFACNQASFAFPASDGEADEADEAEPTPVPVYDGIVIDGKFDDWAAVPRYDISDQKGYDTVDHVSVVWDGPWLYILLVADGDRDSEGNLTGMGNWNSVIGAGTHGNGQFAITSDLGRTRLIQPIVDDSGEPAVAGVDGAVAAVNNKQWAGAPHMWELAIPAAELPEYLESVSFGFYMAEPTITDLMDMQGGSGAAPFGGHIDIDGSYEDWTGYPHTLIQYDHQGTQHHQVDGEAALWSDEGWLYGHVSTRHADHLDEMGSEFLAAISIAFNGERSYKDTPDKGNFYPRILAVSGDGAVTDYTTLNEGFSLPDGIHTFYIFDTRTDPVHQFGHTDADGVWHDATAAELVENAFGVMKITVNGDTDEMEFNLDLHKVAQYIGVDAGDFKVIEAQFGRIGQQWVTTAGTSTGPLLAVALAVGAVAGPMGCAQYRRRAKRGARAGREGGKK